jgi:hypothetical protein
VVCATGTQQIEEGEPGLLRARGGPSEPVIADLNAKAVLSFVACIRVVNRYPTRGLQPGAKHAAGIDEEALPLLSQQPMDLSLEIDTPTRRRAVF